MKALIIAAGEGTRLRPYTLNRPKPMISIMGKPMLEYVIRQLVRIGIEKVVLVVGYRREQIQNYFHNGEEFGLSIEYITQEQQLGEADAILSARKVLENEEQFLMVDSDFFADDDMVKNTWKTAEKRASDVTLALTTVDNPSQFGIVDIDPDNNIKKIVEKPSPGTEPSNLGVSSIYSFSAKIFSALEKIGDLEEAIQDLINTNHTVVGCPWKGTWMDVGRPWDLMSASDYLMKQVLQEGSQIDDSVSIHNTAEIIDPVFIGANVKIMKGAVIRGPVYIGKDCLIGNNSLIRNGTNLGQGVQVGYSNEITHSVIFDNAVISHFVYCGDSVIGQGSHLGAGTITANVRFDDATIHVQVKEKKLNSHMKKLGVILGDNSHTGINVSIYPGRIIGNNCLLGPGVVVKEDVDSDTLVQWDTKRSLKITALKKAS